MKKKPLRWAFSSIFVGWFSPCAARKERFSEMNSSKRVILIFYRGNKINDQL
jgi:hypothetical protein